MSLHGKVAIVTGAAKGLGRAISVILLKQGAKVVLADLNGDVGARTGSELSKKYGDSRVLFVKCDVTNKVQMQDMFKTAKKRFGGLDIVVNNAGVGFEMGDLWELTVNVNLKGTVRGTMLGMDNMRQDKGGRGGVIVNISSMAGINPNPSGPVYGATKAAIVMFSSAWAKNPELLANGVRVNVLAPAFIDTDMVAKLKDRSSIYVPYLADKIIEKVGVMSTETVAEALIDLINDQDRNGAILKISENFGREYTTM